MQSVVCLSPCTQKRGIRASTAAGAAQPTAKEEAPNSGEHTTNDIGFQSDQLSHCILDHHRQTHPKITALAPAAAAPISGIRLTLDHCICYSEGCTKNVNLSWNRSRALDKIKTPLRIMQCRLNKTNDDKDDNLVIMLQVIRVPSPLLLLLLWLKAVGTGL